VVENKRGIRKWKVGKEGGVKKEKIESIFVENYGDIIFIIIFVLYFVFLLQFNANPVNPAIL